MSRLLQNRAQCLYCMSIVESKHRHDFQWCTCGKMAVDGGLEYVRRLGEFKKIKELSIYDSPTTVVPSLPKSENVQCTEKK